MQRVCSFPPRLSLASLAAYFIVRDRIPLTQRPQNSRDRFLRVRNCRRPASSLPAEKEFRAFERLRENCSCSVPPDGNKIARGEADPSRWPRARARAREGRCPFASRFRVREILPSPRLLLAAPAVVARFCSDRISKGNYVSIASIVVNRGARPNMGLLATTITIATSAACTTIEAYEEERPRGRGPRGWDQAVGRTREGKGEEEYCKLLLPLVSCSERWVVCLLPHRTRYCATYLRTHPRQKSSSTSSLSSPSYSSPSSFPSRHRRCRSRPSIGRSSWLRSFRYVERRFGKKRTSRTVVALGTPSPFIRFRNSLFFFATRLRLSIVQRSHKNISMTLDTVINWFFATSIENRFSLSFHCRVISRIFLKHIYLQVK